MKNMILLLECKKNLIRFKHSKIFKNSMLKFQLLNFMVFVKVSKFNLPVILNCILTSFLTVQIGNLKESNKIKTCSLTSNNILKLSLKLSKNLKIHNKKLSFQPCSRSLLKKKANWTSSEKQNFEMILFQNFNFLKLHKEMSKNLFNIDMI